MVMYLLTYECMDRDIAPQNSNALPSFMNMNPQIARSVPFALLTFDTESVRPPFLYPASVFPPLRNRMFHAIGV